MNILQWLLKYSRLDDNNELDLQFGMSVVCIWVIVISSTAVLFYAVKGIPELLYLMISLFIGSWVMFFYCRRKNRQAYLITYLFFCVYGALTHFLTTYYLGDSGTVFLIIAAMLAPHLFPIFNKLSHTVLLDIFFLAVISLVFWLSFDNVPPYADMVGSPFRIILAYYGLVTCMFEFYLNMSSQKIIKTARQKMIEKASAAAVLDALTNLGNRRMLEQHRAELEEARSEKPSPCIVMLDIDFFKKINDTYGHTIGDKVLEFIADAMRDFFRKSDILIRWGGEEFLVILRHTDIEDAAALLEKFRIKMQNMPMPAGDKNININLTIGLTALSPTVSLDDSIKKADELMYQGKLQGRNRLIWDRMAL